MIAGQEHVCNKFPSFPEENPSEVISLTALIEFSLLSISYCSFTFLSPLFLYIPCIFLAQSTGTLSVVQVAPAFLHKVVLMFAEAIGLNIGRLFIGLFSEPFLTTLSLLIFS